MFRLFKKNKENKFGDDELKFFQNIINILPSPYSYLRKSVTKDFILGWKANELGYSDAYTFLLNANLEKEFKNKKLPRFFILKNIGIWEASMKKYIHVELDIFTGFLGGFKSESINFKNFDFTKVDLSAFTEKHFSEGSIGASVGVIYFGVDNFYDDQNGNKGWSGFFNNANATQSMIDNGFNQAGPYRYSIMGAHEPK
ncbi:hypothetical protein VUJ46_02555 [Chryseobacterium sp. MYb264]|uniref:hypothetical protein n=1 Tax=Chryseobacterium sp. MYb264 TaxID=2745153 RepID=UPI002E14DFF6|nr:hypothetical protein VUJ46_02555 [Chryseobacterium sp. MYb264]